jgi:hypothetical protein
MEDLMTLLPRRLIAVVIFLGLSSPATTFAQSASSDPYSWILGTHPRPFSELSWGIDWPHHKNLNAEFPSVGALEFKSGFLYIDTLKNGVVSLGDGFIHGSLYNPSLGGGSGGTAGLVGKLGRFGFGYSQGYGYNLNGTVIVPYFGAKASWTELTSERPTTLTAADVDILNRYEGSFRFGPSVESGVVINFGHRVSLSAGYEASIVYPRFVFWEALGSYVIIGALNGAVTLFGHDYLEDNPTFGPILVFVVRTALGWGAYQLCREDMNWPFHSETPLTHETLKFGFNYVL